MPLKREALALADRVSDTARRRRRREHAGAGRRRGARATTPTSRAPRRPLRERYDGPVGTVTSWAAAPPRPPPAWPCAGWAPRTFRLLVRSPERAAETAAVIAAHPSGPRVEVGSLADDPVTGDVVVSTIPAAAQDEALIARCAATCRSCSRSLYDPWPTPLAASAADRVLVAGLDLLVHQAALQFREFTGLAGAAGGDARGGRDRARRAPGRDMTDQLGAAVARGGAVRRRRAARARADPRRARARAGAAGRGRRPGGPDEEPKVPYADVAAAPGLAWKAALAAALSPARVVGWSIGWDVAAALPAPAGPGRRRAGRRRLADPLPAHPRDRARRTPGWSCWCWSAGWSRGTPTTWSGPAWAGSCAGGRLPAAVARSTRAASGYGDVRLSGVLGIALGYLGWGELLVGVYGGFLLGGRRWRAAGAAAGSSTARRSRSVRSCWWAPWSASRGAPTCGPISSPT